MTTTNKPLLLTVLASVAMAVPSVAFGPTKAAGVMSISGLCLVLWITEAVPPFVPTLILWVLVPAVLGYHDNRYSLTNVLSWAADPVVALFFGGFVLGAATERAGFAHRAASAVVRRSGGSFPKLLALVIAATAMLSMWISNVAAAAVMFAALRPLISRLNPAGIHRRILLVGTALAADLGGMATPIGTGPNGIAMASVQKLMPISFWDWLVFAFPLTLGMLVLTFVMLTLRGGGSGWSAPAGVEERPPAAAGFPHGRFIAIAAATIALWLTEPLHHVPSGVIALGSSVAIFGAGVLGKEDVRGIDWSTLLLIAGGITLGRLLEQAGIMANAVAGIAVAKFGPTFTLLLLCLASASMSALMSNTATVILLIPIAEMILPGPATPILIAVSASFGTPLLISTPANAMAFGEGGVRFGDMFWPGLALMLAGCVVVSLTGGAALGLAGIR